MSDNKSPPFSGFLLNPLRAPAAFEDADCRQNEGQYLQNVDEVDIDTKHSASREPENDDQASVAVNSEQTTSAIDMPSVSGSTLDIKPLHSKCSHHSFSEAVADKNLSGIRDTVTENKNEKPNHTCTDNSDFIVHNVQENREEIKHLSQKSVHGCQRDTTAMDRYSDRKPTVLPPALLHEVTNMVKQEQVIVPSGDNKYIYKKANSIDLNTQSTICFKETTKHLENDSIYELGDSGIKTDIFCDIKADQTSVTETASEVSGLESAEDDEFANPFAQLDIDGLFEDKTTSMDEDATIGKMKKKRKREMKKAKQKAWKRKKKNSQSNDSRDKAGNSEKCDTDSNKPSKPVVNYFVAIQISNPKIKTAVQMVQDNTVSGCKELTPAMNKISTLHLTLFVASIKTEEDMRRSKLALDAAQTILRPLYTLKPLCLDIAGLGHFRHEVVFAKVQSEDQVQQLQHNMRLLKTVF